jgi:hypothetical protein
MKCKKVFKTFIKTTLIALLLPFALLFSEDFMGGLILISLALFFFVVPIFMFFKWHEPWVAASLISFYIILLSML